MSSGNLLSKKKDNKYKNIKSLASSLNLEMILSLEERQYESLNIKYKEIEKVEDLNNFCPKNPLEMKKLTSLIELQSNNFLFNSILFINQSSNIKYPIKYLIPFSPKFPQELYFMYEVIKTITEINYIYIEEYNILDIKPNIVFTLKLIENDLTVDEKSFLIVNENNYRNNNNIKIVENKKEENIYNGDLYKELNFEYDCDIFYTTISDLFNCKKNSENEIVEFIQKLVNKNPKTKICINFDENYLSINKDFIENVFSNTDIFIIEKKDVINFYDNLFKHVENDEDNKNTSITKKDNILANFFVNKIKTTKINQQIKLGIFINDMKEIFLIQQDPNSNSILFEINQNLDLIPQNKKEDEQKMYKQLIKSDYNSLKSVYIGAFLNRLIRQESFFICLKDSLKCTIKYIDIKKFGLDVPTVQNYYEIKINKKNKKFKINKLENKIEIKNKLLENKFILDCTNLNNKINTYNSLYDENCMSFFNSKEIRKHLQRQGFINKKGKILLDPKKNKENIVSLSKKDKKKILEKNPQKINIKRNKDNSKEKMKQISPINKENIKNLHFKNFEMIHYYENNINNIRPFYLPTLNNKYKNKSPSFPSKINTEENNKEDISKKYLNLNNKPKKYLSSVNINNKKILNPIKSNKINIYGYLTINLHRMNTNNI